MKRRRTKRWAGLEGHKKKKKTEHARSEGHAHAGTDHRDKPDGSMNTRTHTHAHTPPKCCTSRGNLVALKCSFKREGRSPFKGIIHSLARLHARLVLVCRFFFASPKTKYPPKKNHSQTSVVAPSPTKNIHTSFCLLQHRCGGTARNAT